MRGGQWQVLRLVEGLAAAGVESTLLAREEAPLYTAARKRGWRVEPLGVTRALGCLRAHDLIHAHDARSHTLGAFLRARPLVVSRRVAFPVGSRWKYGRARHYLAVSEFVKGVLMQGGVPEEKISVVYDGVPVLEVSHGTQVLGLEKDSALLARMGSEDGLPPGRGPRRRRDSGVRDEQRRAGLRRAAGHVGGCAGDREQGGRPRRSDPARRERTAGGKRRAPSSGASANWWTIPSGPGKWAMAGRRTVMERFTVEQMAEKTIKAYRQVLASY